MADTLATENLYRVSNDLTVTRTEGVAMPTLTGHFAVWDQWTEIRSLYENAGRPFLERFTPNAMNKTLSERTPKVLFQHGKDPQIGDKVLGPVQRVEPDQTGAFYEVALLDTSYNRDLIPGLEAGLYGSSFRFTVEQQDYVEKPKRSQYNPRGIPERTVTEARVAEFGPCTFPAYAGATAGIRSVTDEFLINQFLQDDDMVERVAEAVAKKTRTVSVSFNGARVEPAAAEEISELVSDENYRADEPEPPEATTPAVEPELPVATTHHPVHDRFWFVAPPKHLKG